ncbi:hypothetical protein FE784_24695 [Paenibacillus hemerocallicola]|uniref:Uncharacterized protein n=1 Tax=Paenibacillus hemerocallicola TaxID=1172614 RepID=A0A5C4T3N9_9BACL|nr:hypothetical protein [Paenibacillus hemerocallicola]TNJ63651.1 hypothetical protein FE784_24695 [Paenibacillus hemerocallicola]
MKRLGLLLITATLLLSACNTPTKEKGCASDVDWVDFIKFNDIMYGFTGHLQTSKPNVKLGPKIGEVKYKLTGNACSNHEVQHADAAFLPVGTPIYEQLGYKHEFRLIAGDKIYQVMVNPKAKFVKELYDIEGKVEKITIFRDTHDQDIRTIEQSKTNALTNLFLEREIIGFEEIFKRGVPKTEYQFFIDFHLKDGTAVRSLYRSASEIMNPGVLLGAGMEKELKEIIKKEWSIE